MSLNLEDTKREVEEPDKTRKPKNVNTSLTILLQGRAKKPLVDNWQDESSRISMNINSLRPSNISLNEANATVR